MTGENSDYSIQLWRAFGEPDPPSNISQEAHEQDRRHLRRLARLRPGDRADGGDLYKYTQDLRYTQIEDALLVYLLPFCLQAWRENLRQVASGYGGFVENFYPALLTATLSRNICLPGKPRRFPSS